MGNQRIDQRAGFMPRSGMHHQPRRFVEHDQMIILIADIQCNQFGQRFGRLGLGQDEADPVAQMGFMLGIIQHHLIDRDSAFQQ